MLVFVHFFDFGPRVDPMTRDELICGGRRISLGYAAVRGSRRAKVFGIMLARSCSERAGERTDKTLSRSDGNVEHVEPVTMALSAVGTAAAFFDNRP